MVGDRVVEGKENLSNFLKGGAVDGTRELANGKTCAFCDVFEVSNDRAAAIIEITSYVIEIERC